MLKNLSPVVSIRILIGIAKQIRIPSELQVLREHVEHLWEHQEHRVLEEHAWEDIDWQLPNNFPPGDVKMLIVVH